MANENMMAFMERFDELKAVHPGIFLQIKEYSKEPVTWRIHIIGKGMSPCGDSELLYVEAESREEAFKKALEGTKGIESNIKNLKEIKADYVRRILANHIK